jgi:regulator of PEP synthase PpsR (kinase-PPPase family)
LEDKQKDMSNLRGFNDRDKHDVFSKVVSDHIKITFRIQGRMFYTKWYCGSDTENKLPYVDIHDEADEFDSRLISVKRDSVLFERTMVAQRIRASIPFGNIEIIHVPFNVGVI